VNVPIGKKSKYPPKMQQCRNNEVQNGNCMSSWNKEKENKKSTD
jgi:hypothetical protein